MEDHVTDIEWWIKLHDQNNMKCEKIYLNTDMIISALIINMILAYSDAFVIGRPSIRGVGIQIRIQNDHLVATFKRFVYEWQLTASHQIMSHDHPGGSKRKPKKLLI